MDRRVVVTGMAVINAAGIGIDAFWNTVSEGRPALKPISRFDTTNFPVKIAGEVSGFDPALSVNRRLLRKSDRFTHYALTCSSWALEQAGISLDDEDMSRIGVWFGNDTGGWDLAERGFNELYNRGAAMVNPYGATAWFPTAPQGFITIQHGITGFSKSLVCDRATGGVALYLAWRAIRSGRNDVVLTGGTEAPITALGLTCYYETGELTTAENPTNAYRPFDRSASGLVMGEGSVVIVLEEFERAKRRGAQIYGELTSGAMTFDPDVTKGAGFEAAVRKCLQSANCRPREIDLVIAEGSANSLCDQIELETYSLIFSDSSETAITAPKCMFGHLFGASSGTDAVCGLLAIRTKQLPPTPSITEMIPMRGIRCVAVPENSSVSRFLVTTRGREGVNVSLAFSAPR